jgi:hypothetical protein
MTPPSPASDFVFVAGNMAFRSDGTLDPNVHVGSDKNWGGETAFRRQVRYVTTERLVPSLMAAASALEHSLKPRRHREHPGFHGRVVAALPRHSMRDHPVPSRR